jgi:MFS family permease
MAIVVHFTAFTSVFTFIPVQASRLGATSTDLGFITMASLGSAAVASLAAPVLARRWGHRRTILSGSLLLGAGLLIVPFINRVLTLGVAQLVNGTGRGILYTLLMALSIRNVSPDKRATSMGVFQAFTAVGMVTGPLASGFLASSMSVSSVFYLSSALCLIPAGMSFLRILPRGEEGQPPVERHH